MFLKSNRKGTNYIANAITIVGVFAILIALASAFVYAVVNDILSEGVRIFLGVIFSLFLLGVGVYTHKIKTHWSLINMGGSILVGFLSIYYAVLEYGIISYNLGILMVLLYVIGYLILSYIYDSKIILSYAGIGGFFVPFLIGPIDSIPLFSYIYYVILFISIVSLSYIKDWSWYRVLSSMVLLILVEFILFEKGVLSDNISAILFLILGALIITATSLKINEKEKGEMWNIESFLMFAISTLQLFFIVSISSLSSTLSSYLYMGLGLMFGVPYLIGYYKNSLKDLHYAFLMASVLFINLAIFIYAIDLSMGTDILYFIFLIEWILSTLIWMKGRDNVLSNYSRFVSFLLLSLIALWYIFVIRFDSGLTHATTYLIGLAAVPAFSYYVSKKSSQELTYLFVLFFSSFFFVFTIYKYFFFFFDEASQLPSITLTIMWLLLSIGFIVFSNFKNLNYLRYLSYIFLTISIGKMLFVDLLILEGMARIIGFLIVGIILLSSGFFLSKK